jgi:hypothetical protein
VEGVESLSIIDVCEETKFMLWILDDINILFHFSMEVHPKVISNIQQASNMTHKERSLIGYQM